MLDFNPPNKPWKIPTLIANFTNRLEAIKFSFETILEFIELNQNKLDEERIDFIKPFLTKEETDTELKLKIELPLAQLPNLSKISKSGLNYRLSSPLVKRTFIISLVSEFDIFLSQLIRAIFYIKPEILNALDKQISFKQILEFDNLNSVKEHILEKEIETVLRESHTEHFKWLETKLGFNTLRKFDTKVWEDFIELTERRNLFVHCDGIVSSQYVKVCKENSVDNIKSIEVGKTLDVNKKYFHKAYSSIYEISIKLVHTIWRKLRPEEREEADNELNNLCVKLIAEEEYNLAIILLDFAFTEPIIKPANLQAKFLFTLNKAQTLKWSGQSSKVSELLNKQDWSVCSDEINLAKAVLLDEFDKAAKFMELIGNNPEKISIIHYRQWPIFKEFRGTQQFKETYQKIFNEPFEMLTEISPFIVEADKEEE
ncbi:hypothetical protein [Laspinema olomoucense]|uniref:Uncharacterized protein n=1 Tax=Laspinema olomoucense D3b TaxID=2953688 RepID=A0ABT2N4K7_9CYAN|nr:hypothetical protein [Laspinema sp. D3b]MCT7977617.1 hypothetical protein [Laspinema sp. D3b]